MFTQVIKRFTIILKVILKQRLVLLISILVGFIFVVPFLLAASVSTPSGEVFTGIPHGDYGIYASQVRDVYEGKLFQSDGQLSEYANGPPIFQILGSTFLGLIARLLGNFNFLIVFEAFLVGFLLFIFSFFLMFSFTRSRAWSILAGFIFVAGYPIFIRLTPYSLDGFGKLFGDLFLLGKLPVNPVIASFPYNPLYILFQLVSIYLLHKSLLTKRNIYVVLSGIVSGLLFYTNIFHWTIFFSGLSILFLFVLIRKDNISAKILLVIALIAFLVSVPFWFIFLQNSDIDAFKTFGLFHKRYIEYFFSSRYLLFALLFFVISKTKRIETEYLAISFTLAGVLCLNAQLLLGFTLVPNHWPARLEIFLMLFSAYFFWLFLKEFQFKHKIVRFLWKERIPFAILGILILLSYLISYQIKFSKTGMNDYFLEKKQYELYQWMNQNTPKDSVVLGLDTNYIYSLTSHTHNRIFMSYAGFSRASLEEQRKRIGLAYSLLNVREQDLKNEFDKTGWVGAHFNFLYDSHKYYYLYQPSDYPENIWSRIQKTDPVRSWYIRYLPGKDRQIILEKYQKHSGESLLQKLTHFKLDYILIGPYEMTIDANIANFSNRIIKVFDNGEYRLYRINKFS